MFFILDRYSFFRILIIVAEPRPDIIMVSILFMGKFFNPSDTTVCILSSKLYFLIFLMAPERAFLLISEAINLIFFFV